MDFSCFKGMRVLLTGHTGFKGSWMSRWLQDLGAQVTGIALDPLAGRGAYVDAGLHEGLVDHRLDICRRQELDKTVQAVKPELVFHMAAQPLVLKSYQEPVETFDTNIMGTCHLLESLRRVEGLRGVVCITTDKVYENKESPNGYTETDHLGGYDPYSSSKAACELVIASYARSFFNDKKIPLVSVRAGNVIGGGDWAENRLVPDFFRAYEKGVVLEMRSPASVRPWQHVMEPLSGYLTVAAAILRGRLTTHEALNFGPKPDAQVSVATVIDGLNRQLAQSGKRGIEVKYVDPKHHETSLLWLNCEKAFKILGWEPRLDIETTLKLTAEFYLQNLVGASKPALRQLMSTHIKFYSERMQNL